MTDIKELEKLDAGVNIKVIGVGGGGNNAVDRMIADKLRGIDFINVNTDSQSLVNSHAKTNILICAPTKDTNIPSNKLMVTDSIFSRGAWEMGSIIGMAIITTFLKQSPSKQLLSTIRCKTTGNA